MEDRSASFLQRHLVLLDHEQRAEHESQQLLISAYPPKVLAQNGLALLHLHIRSKGGMQGQEGQGSSGTSSQLVELVMSPAYHSETAEFPPHTFRPGDIAELQNEAAPSASATSTGSKQRSGNKSKSKQRANDAPASEKTAGDRSSTSPSTTAAISAVVYRVYENRITVALKRKPTSSLSLPSSASSSSKAASSSKKKSKSSGGGGEEGLFRLIKVANDSTYDRMKAALLDAAQRIGVKDAVERGVEQELLQMRNDPRKQGAGERQQRGEKKPPAEMRAGAKANADTEQAGAAVESATVDAKREMGVQDSIADGSKEDLGDAEEQEEGEEDAEDGGTESDTADEQPASIVAESGDSIGAPRSTLLKALLGLSPFVPGVTSQVRSAPRLPIDPPFNAGLNSSQIEAIMKCIYLPGSGTAAEKAGDQGGPVLPFHLIHGPPGTGKTTTVVELLLQIALGMQLDDRKPPHLQPSSVRDELTTAGPSLRPARILVCGASNLAVDTIAERLLSPSASWSSTLKEKSIRITRIGHPARVLASLTLHTLDAQVERSDANLLVRDIHREIAQHMHELNPDPAAARSSSTKRLKGSARKDKWELVRSLRKELRHRQTGISTSVLSQAHIVLSTLHGAGDRSLFKTRFDYIIIDEACQALEPSCWIAALKAREDDFGGAKLILAGDHRQLGPTIKSEPIQRFVKMKRIERRKRGQAERARRKEAAGDQQEKDATRLEQDEEEEDSDEDCSHGEADDDADEQEELMFAEESQAWPIRELTLPATIERTMFDRLLTIYGPSCKSLLSVQYRMNKEIMAFPNQAMYDGKLEAHSSCADIRLADLPKFEAGAEAEGEEEESWEAPVTFLDTQGANMHEKAGEDPASGKIRVISTESKFNEHEVELVEKHLASLVSHGLDPGSIAIIAPYSAQVATLAAALRPKYPLIEIGTVDGMQGREKDAVIITLVRSNDKHEVGFLREKRRLNVAMTRAKRHLAIIGDSDTVAAREPYLKAWMNHLQDHAVLEYAFT